ncbi:MAG: polysaccharide deacetylase family protein [Rhodospirillaceae bacterium]|nr:polysaccharide deacetylase family protein [Rhodospirillaceae bacterium]
MMRHLIKFLVLAILLFAAPAWAESTSAVVLMYHRFGEAKYPTTNTTLAQLDAHIAYLRQNTFNVVPLSDIVQALKDRKPLTPKTIAITIDDAYKSVFTEAFPRFKKAGFPFTVFVATEAVDKKYTDIMTWDDLRTLKAAGVSLEGHSHAHPHAPALSTDEVAQDLETMKARFKAELNIAPALYAHPYGEAGRADLEIVRKAGFDAAFGQNSGPVYAEGDMFLLPRFALNEHYGAMDRFQLVVNTKPLRAVDVQPSDPVLRDAKPVLTFTVHEPPGDLLGLSCFGPRGERLNTSANKVAVTVTPTTPFPTGRARVNCTIKVQNQWYWFGQEFLAGGMTEGVRVHPRYLK